MSIYEKRSYLGASLYLMLFMAVASMHVVFIGIFGEQFGITFVQVNLGISFITLMAFLTGLAASVIIKKLTARRCMIMGIVFMVLYGVLMATASGYATYLTALCVFGLGYGICTHGCVTAFIVERVRHNQAGAISFAVGTAMLGTPVGQAVASALFSANIGFEAAYLATCLGFALAALIVVLFVIPGEEPQKTDKVIQEAASEEKPDETHVSVRGLYANPAFYFMLVAVFIGGVTVCYVANYLTTYLPMLGVDYGTASLFVSIMGFATAIFMMTVGRRIEQMGVKRFLTLGLAGCALANFCMILYGYKTNIMLLIATTVFYAMGFGISFSMNMISLLVFGEEFSVEANTKLIAAGNIGTSIMVPVLASIVEHYGFTAFYAFVIVIDILTFICYMLSLRFAKRSKAC